MQLGMIGLGRMGGSMVQRLLKGGHQCVVFDSSSERVASAVENGAAGAQSLHELLARLDAPRVIWMMVPAHVVDSVLEELSHELRAGDIVIDGGNTHYVDDVRRAAALNARGIHYVDVGVSGGVWGLDRGYCLMIGGDQSTAQHLTPIFRTLAPGSGASTPVTDRSGAPSTASEGYLHCGPAGAGHFVKMVHNAIEYALMAAYAEGFNLLARANAGAPDAPATDTMPLRDPQHFQYAFALPDIAEVWRHGSVIGSWLLDLTASALAADPALQQFAGRVSDSGEGRWAAHAAIDSATPAPVLTAALFQRFTSRGEGDMANRLLSAMRHQFGGHREPPAHD
ncbi:MAG TPA: decarboxylating 6-phosphogluconate dehydrogenase [Vicinamibacterales bacterium]|nr:decarboxylating 6-phosphogluconate dehydrogenase [Vicinamibacterales bacterium]